MIHCPGCGGGLRFDIASQLMSCDYCGNHYDPDATASMSKESNGKKIFESYVFSCPSCGGELMTTDEHDAVGFCPFCGGASMLFDRIHEQWQPEYIIPFQVTKEQCKELYAKAAKRSLFTSRKYADPQLIEGFRGIYMPYWCYQTVQKGQFRLQGKQKGFATITEYRITGDTDVQLDGYAHDAAQNFDDRISEEIAPFDPQGHRPFAPGYLSGFYADIGDVNAHSYEAVGEKCMSEDTAKLMAQEKTIVSGGSGLTPIHVDIAASSVPTKITSAKRTLYPVWFMSYRNNDKITYAAVNGQTGKVTADLPVSPLRILLTVLIVGVAVAALLFMLPALKANWALMFSIALLVVGYLVLKINFSRTVTKENGLLDTEEAKRFKKKDKWRTLAVIAAAVLGGLIAYADLAYNVPTYLMCMLLAGVLFYVMCSHIRFQAEIAKRRPPQFNKKGAASDEN